jgi:hypothetical protein
LVAVAVVTVRGVTVKAPEVSPWAIVIAAGKLTSGKEALTPTEAPPLGAAAFRSTVQVETAGGVRDDGEQVNPFNSAGCTMVTVPPVADEANGNASEDAAISLEIWTCEVVSVVKPEMASDTKAATPFAIVSSLSPHSTQVAEPMPALHETNLLDATATGPAVTVAEEKSTPG